METRTYYKEGAYVGRSGLSRRESSLLLPAPTSRCRSKSLHPALLPNNMPYCADSGAVTSCSLESHFPFVKPSLM